MVVSERISNDPPTGQTRRHLELNRKRDHITDMKITLICPTTWPRRGHCYGRRGRPEWIHEFRWAMCNYGNRSNTWNRSKGKRIRFRRYHRAAFAHSRNARRTSCVKHSWTPCLLFFLAAILHSYRDLKQTYDVAAVTPGTTGNTGTLTRSVSRRP